MSIKRIIFALTAALIAAVGVALIWFDSHFEEPEAIRIPSISKEVGAKSVLAIFAHPDDEQLITGLLIRAEREGAVTRMITATKGEAGTPRPQVSRPEDLGLIRHAEVLKNGYALGVQEQQVWEYPDSGLSDLEYGGFVARIERQISDWEPDLVVTFWPESGFSDHADHKRVGLAATQAVRNLIDTEPASAPSSMAYILAPRRMMRRFGGESGLKIADNQPAPTHAMPGEGWAKIRGWDIHASQRDYVQSAYGFPPAIVHRLYDKEHYRVVRFDREAGPN
jgi:LmbE family N-acetylglucosaminyl deacetylase